MFIYAARLQTKFGLRRKLRKMLPEKILGPVYTVHEIVNVQTYRYIV